MKYQLKKVFTSTPTNVDNKTAVDKVDVKPDENFRNFRKRNFIHQEIRVTDNKIVIEDPSVEMPNILKSYEDSKNKNRLSER